MFVAVFVAVFASSCCLSPHTNIIRFSNIHTNKFIENKEISKNSKPDRAYQICLLNLEETKKKILSPKMIKKRQKLSATSSAQYSQQSLTQEKCHILKKECTMKHYPT